MTPVTISGAVVDAELMINYLSGQIAEQALQIAVLRCQVASWSALARARVVDGVPEPDRASESPPEPSQTASGAPSLLTPDPNGRGATQMAD